MSETPPKTPTEWPKGRKEYSSGEADDATRELLDDLESTRVSLGMYPQAFGIAVQQALDTPYDSSDPIVDGFIAVRILRIYQQFAERLKRIGINDVDDPYAELARVDLSAAGDDDNTPDDEAISRSFHDDDSRSSAESDRDISSTAGLANDDEIRRSLDVEGLDAAMDGIASDGIEETLGRIGGNQDDDDSSDGDDVSGGGGSGRVQLGMLDIGGTFRDPSLLAGKTSKVLFECVVKGFKGEEGSRPGLADRMQPLEEFGEVDIKTVRLELRRLLVDVESIVFRAIDESC